MNRNKHLLLWSSLGVLALLIVAAARENFLKEWRQIQQTARGEAGPIPVHLRQVVVPAVRVADRCVTCHVGMAPGEQGITGDRMAEAHRPVHHDPGQFGCTVCHAGQGRATEKDDAHGRVHFWPRPMIPVKYAYAGCGACHKYVNVPGERLLAEGRGLFEQFDCYACHRLDGKGGTLRPGGAGGMEGPDLSQVGLAGYKDDWYAHHLRESQAAGADLWKEAFAPIAERRRKPIDTYLGSRVGAPGLIEAQALFHSLGCRGCHKVDGVGGDGGPDLTGVGEKDPGQLDFSHVPGERTLAHWLAEHTRAPYRVVPNSQMPVMDLTEAQIDRLTLYMLSLRSTDLPEAFWPKDRMKVERFGDRQFAEDGATLYGTFCAACHGEAGDGRRYPGMPPFPSVANADFLAAADDQFLAETIRRGRLGRRMPAWGASAAGLRPKEIEAIVDRLRRLGETPAPPPDGQPRRWVRGDREQGDRLFSSFCSGCHGARGEGIEGPALNNKSLLDVASDTFFVETIRRGRRGTTMPSFGSGSTTAPALSPEQVESVVTFLRTWEQR